MRYKITYTKTSEHIYTIEAHGIPNAVLEFGDLPTDTLEKEEEPTVPTRKVTGCEEDPYTDFN